MTNLLHKYSKRKTGWRVKFLFDDSGKPINDKVMVINGLGNEYLIATEDGTPDDKVGHFLEDLVTKFLKDVEEKDLIFVSKETLMFMVFAKVIRTQSQLFIGYLTKDKKHDLQLFNNHVDKMVKSLESNYMNMLGKEQVELFSKEMEGVVIDLFSVFKDSLDNGSILGLMNHVKEYYAPSTKNESDK